MTKSNERKELQKKFRGLHRELNELRAKLNKVGPEKEKWFKKKEDLKEQVGELIREVRERRESKNKINSKVKNLKEKREEKNKEVKEKIEKAKGLRGLSVKTSGFERGLTSSDIKRQVENLELRIETEALKFSEEKKLMRKISKLKQEYERLKKEEGVVDEKSKVDEEINVDKKIAEEFHKQVQEMAQKGKKEYESYLVLSNKIKNLNAEQEKAFENFLRFKNEFNEVSKKLKGRLEEVGEVKRKLDVFQKEKEKSKKKKVEEILEEKSKSVEEKLKKGEKLTTEDLIRFQGSKD